VTPAELVLCIAGPILAGAAAIVAELTGALASSARPAPEPYGLVDVEALHRQAIIDAHHTRRPTDGANR
jgi:hypothetical protein